MLLTNSKSAKPCFHVPTSIAIVLGSILCIVFYGLQLIGPLNFAGLRRYCSSHPMAIAAVWLFCVVLAALAFKWRSVTVQQKWLSQSKSALDDIAVAQGELQTNTASQQKAECFDTLWRTQPASQYYSWLGQRITAAVQRQLHRQNTKFLHEDLLELSRRDADQLRESHALIRIAVLAMPMLGFIGTLLSLSGTLGGMNIQALTSGSQNAANQLAAGLYLAFNSTAVGLVLTTIVLFLQLGVHRLERSYLSAMDAQAAESMHRCLSETESVRDTSPTESALQRITEELIQSVHQLVQTQTELWNQTMNSAASYWQNMASNSSEQVQNSLTLAIENALKKHDESLLAHTENLARIQTEGAVLIDSRWQQWQTTFSEQARAIHLQQHSMTKQTELLTTLIEKHEAIRDMEPPLQATLQRLTDIDRFHDAAICLTEAVAVLGTQMERYGYLGRQPIRRSQPDASVMKSTEDPGPATLPMKRQAG